LQPCPTYNDINTKDWYAGEDRKDASGKPQSRLYKLEETGFDPVVRDWKEDWQKKAAALEKAQEWGDRIPIGIIYRKERPVFEKSLKVLRNIPLVKQPVEPGQLQKLLDNFS